MSGKDNIRKFPKKSQRIERKIVNGVTEISLVDDSKPKTQSTTKNK